MLSLYISSFRFGLGHSGISGRAGRQRSACEPLGLSLPPPPPFALLHGLGGALSPVGLGGAGQLQARKHFLGSLSFWPSWVDTFLAFATGRKETFCCKRGLFLSLGQLPYRWSSDMNAVIPRPDWDFAWFCKRRTWPTWKVLLGGLQKVPAFITEAGFEHRFESHPSSTLRSSWVQNWWLAGSHRCAFRHPFLRSYFG